MSEISQTLPKDTDDIVKGNKRPADEDATENSLAKKQHCDVRNVPIKRVKYKNYGVLLSYCGKNYYGMQLQRSTELNTIEDLLLKAMADAGFIEEKGMTTPQNYHFQRASRTDKGVSAVRQVISLNLPESATNIPETLNDLLPEDIRILKAVRVTRSFNSKKWCDSRTYSYLCPTYAFAPTDQQDQAYRLPPSLLEEINDVFKTYVGCHKFHNYTSGKSFHEASSNRYIVSMQAEEPFDREGYQWIRIKIHGHSFMLHQIRKMIGLVMAIAKGLASKNIIHETWGEDRVDVPKAPGLGLVLEEPHFSNYNKKFGADGSHEPLTWDDVDNELVKFRNKYIDSVIIETEVTEKSMLSWLSTLPLHEYAQTQNAKKSLHKKVDDNGNTDSSPSNNYDTPEQSNDGSVEASTEGLAS